MNDLQRSNSDQTLPPPYGEPSSQNSPSMVISPTGHADRPYIIDVPATGGRAGAAAVVRNLEPARVRDSRTSPHDRQYEPVRPMTIAPDESQDETTGLNAMRTRCRYCCEDVVHYGSHARAVCCCTSLRIFCLMCCPDSWPNVLGARCTARCGGDEWVRRLGWIFVWGWVIALFSVLSSKGYLYWSDEFKE
jgi:hypothetical protein